MATIGFSCTCCKSEYILTLTQLPHIFPFRTQTSTVSLCQPPGCPPNVPNTHPAARPNAATAPSTGPPPTSARARRRPVAARCRQNLGTVLVAIGDGLVIPKMKEFRGPSGGGGGSGGGWKESRSKRRSVEAHGISKPHSRYNARSKTSTLSGLFSLSLSLSLFQDLPTGGHLLSPGNTCWRVQVEGWTPCRSFFLTTSTAGPFAKSPFVETRLPPKHFGLDGSSSHGRMRWVQMRWVQLPSCWARFRMAVVLRLGGKGSDRTSALRTAAAQVPFRPSASSHVRARALRGTCVEVPKTQEICSRTPRVEGLCSCFERNFF